MSIDKNDPRLTEYALGELPESDRRSFEELLANDKSAWATINEISDAARISRESLEDANALNLTDEQRERVTTALNKPRRAFLAPRVWVSAAACFLIAALASTMLWSRDALRARDAEIGRLESEYAAKQQMISRLTMSTTSEPQDSYNARGFGGGLSALGSTRSSNAGGGVAGVGIQPATPDGAAGGSGSSIGFGGGFSSAGRSDGESGVVRFRIDTTVPALNPGKQKGSADDLSRARVQVAALPETRGFDTNSNVRSQSEPSNTEAYDNIRDNEFLTVAESPLSTFSIDVDTASYANIRRFLNQDQLPPKDAVRIEEMINYFDYDYAPPTGEHPFAVHVEVASCPWKPEHQLARVGLKGRTMEAAHRPAANLVFLIDVSGSMNQPNKLPLVVESMKLLVNELAGDDTIALAVYAGSSGLVLPPTSGVFREPIIQALDNLKAGGSTNGAGGIELAYQIATTAFIKDGINRVILATDGDFNVGVTSMGDLTRLIEEKAKSGVFLSVLGYGMGNLKDATMEQLADKGNGNYAYIDTLREAEKVLVKQMSGTLVTIAKDVKIQVDFNPAEVQAYRLIGYENRVLAAKDFEDDTKDAGEIGAGHTVTALYELVPAGAAFTPSTNVSPSVYRQTETLSSQAQTGELMQVRLRYKLPESDTSIPFVVPVAKTDRAFTAASEDFRFSASVASFGMLLRDSPYKGNATIASTIELADNARGEDVDKYRAEFIGLMRAAERFMPLPTDPVLESLRSTAKQYRIQFGRFPGANGENDKDLEKARLLLEFAEKYVEGGFRTEAIESYKRAFEILQPLMPPGQSLVFLE